MARNVTIACMDSCGAGITRYGIYRARLHEGKKPFVDVANAERVTTVTLSSDDRPRWSAAGNDLSKFYFTLAEPYGTPDFPAFSFNYR